MPVLGGCASLFIAALFLAGCASGSNGSGRHTSAALSTGPPASRLSDPVRDGEVGAVAAPLSQQCTPWTIAQAQADAPFSVLMPQVALANASSLTHVWNCPAQVVEQFSSGILIQFEHSTIADPGRAWRRLAAGDPDEATLGTVQGQPASLISPSAGATGDVTFVLGDTLIYTLGNGHASLDDLIEIADSLMN